MKRLLLRVWRVLTRKTLRNKAEISIVWLTLAARGLPPEKIVPTMYTNGYISKKQLKSEKRMYPCTTP